MKSLSPRVSFGLIKVEFTGPYETEDFHNNIYIYTHADTHAHIYTRLGTKYF